MHAGEATCRSYRFGHVTASVFPELVTIEVPYGAEHESFIDASLFVERYTHAASAVVLEDDDLGIELHVYPNTEVLVSSGPPTLPPLDPRLGHWDEPTRRPDSVDLRTGHFPRPLLMTRVAEFGSGVEQYLQETAARGGIALLMDALPRLVQSVGH